MSLKSSHSCVLFLYISFLYYILDCSQGCCFRGNRNIYFIQELVLRYIKVDIFVVQENVLMNGSVNGHVFFVLSLKLF